MDECESNTILPQFCLCYFFEAVVDCSTQYDEGSLFSIHCILYWSMLSPMTSVISDVKQHPCSPDTYKHPPPLVDGPQPLAPGSFLQESPRSLPTTSALDTYSPIISPMSSQSSRARSPSINGQDGLTALLKMISNMSVQEIDEGIVRHGDSSQTASRSDTNLASSLFAEEAEGLLNVAKDHLIHGVRNEDLLQELLEIEETARYDHLMAVALSEGRDPPPRAPIQSRNTYEREITSPRPHC